MTATYRTFDEALDIALRDIRSRWSGADTSAGSPLYHLACVMVAQRMGATGYAKNRYLATRPDKARGSDLVELAGVYGLTKHPATQAWGWELTVPVSGGALAYPAAMQMTTASGIVFETTVAGSWIAADDHVHMQCNSVSTGAGANLPVGTTLTVTAPPAGMNATATVYAYTGAVHAADEESDDALQRRLSAKVGGVGTSGNEAAFQTWILSDECAITYLDDALVAPAEAYCYPGIRSVMDLSAVACVPWDGIQKRPAAGWETRIETYVAGIAPTGTSFDAIRFTEQAVTVRVNLATDVGYGRDWGNVPTSLLTTAAAAHTSKRIYTTADPAFELVGAGNRILTFTGANFFPCVRTVASIDSGGTPFIELTEGLVDESGNEIAATNGRTIYPGSPIMQSCVDAVLGIFERMTPGDTVDDRRYPPVSQAYPVDISSAMIHRALLDVSDHIWDVTITTGTATCTASALSGTTLLAYILQPSRANGWLRIEFDTLIAAA